MKIDVADVMGDDSPIRTVDQIRREIEVTIENFVGAALESGEANERREENQKNALDKTTVVSSSKVNIYLVDQVVQLIVEAEGLGIDNRNAASGKRKGRKKAKAESQGYPYKLVEDIFTKFIEKVLTLSCKNGLVTLITDALGKIYERLVSKDQLRDRSQNAHKFVTKIIQYLADVHLLPTLSAGLQARSAFMLTQIIVLTKS